MRIEELLPVGSVVLLQKAQKKMVIMGIMPVKHSGEGNDIAYEYMGVPYPEGYMGGDTALLFNHEDIKDVYFTGYVNEERDSFIKIMQGIVDRTEEIVSESED